MSVSSVSSSSPPPSPPPVSTETTKPQTQDTQTRNRTQQSQAFKPDKTGDEAAAEKQASRPPLPPGQGTRVDILA
ncbi:MULTISPECIES: hypothetical protein [unclassified Bradyrhizobium]|uniref:hypothetical protein n=1 Tax=unclassified Bradyrhizobium TaxID=2631580 RepID=UPI002916CE99|nr:MULTISPECIES: hypothetical protein [unclassified Bradyrhizobium]